METADPSSCARSDRRAAFALALILVALTLATFYPITRNNFINYDDPEYITQNPHVQQGLSFSNVRWAFSTGHAGNYHPLTWISLMTDRTIFGSAPRGFHTTNLILHAFNAGLLLLVLRAATGSTWRSALAAALFALHPLRVESVAWATERKDVLSMFFALLTLGAYAHYSTGRSPMRYLLVTLLLELALLSKSTVVTLPAVMLLLDFWPLRRVRLEENEANPLRRPIGRLVLEKLPLLGLSLIACVATMLAQSAGGAVGSIEKYPLGPRLANAAVSYLRYIRKMLLPTDLAVFYPNHGGFSAWLVIGSVVALIAITVIALRRRVQSPGVTVGWLWFLGALVPMIGLVQSGAQSMADRFTYLPMIGLVIAAAWAIPQRVFDTSRGRIALAGVTCVALIVMCALTRGQISHWHDSHALFTHTLAVTKGNHVAHNNLAFELAHRRQFEEAKAHYQAALKISPTYSVAHNGLGSVLARTGDPDAALREYALAIRFNPRYVIAHRNLAGRLAAAGQMDRAIEHYRRAIEIQPNDPAVRSLLALALAQTERVSEAVEHFRAAVDADPTDAQAHVNLGHALVETKRPAEALVVLRRAMALDAKSSDAHYHAGAALALLGDLPAAAGEFRTALSIHPDDREARAALDQVLVRLRQHTASVAE